jgi:hypothetical protein
LYKVVCCQNGEDKTEFEIIKGGCHLLHLFRPEEFDVKLTRFLDRQFDKSVVLELKSLIEYNKKSDLIFGIS